LPLEEVEGLCARKPPHLLESFDWDQGRQRFPFAFDDEFVVPEGDAVQHVPDPLANIDR
jgi:hypothetical protein